MQLPCGRKRKVMVEKHKISLGLPACVRFCNTLQAEVDRLIFEDADPETGFLLHPDLKWVSIPANLFCLLAPFALILLRA